MKSIRHLLYKDWLAQRLPIILWLGINVLGLVSDLRQSAIQDAHMARSAGTQMLYLIAIVLLYKIIVVRTVGEDTPAKRENFLAARPVTFRQLWSSKIFFIGIVIILPLIFRNILYLAINGQGIRTIFLGTMQAMLWIIPLTIIVGSFFSLWESKGRLYLALIYLAIMISASLGFGVSALSLLALRYDHFDGERPWEPFPMVCALSFTAVLFLIFTCRKQSFYWPLRKRLVVTNLIGIAGILFWLFIPVTGPIIQPSTSEKLLLATEGELSPVNTGYQFTWFNRPHKLGIQLLLSPDRPEKLSPSQDIHWAISQVRYGETLYSSPVRPAHKILQNINNTLNPPMINAVESHIGGKIQWCSNTHRPNNNRNLISDNKPFPADPNSTDPLSVSATLSGTLYQWEITADLALKAGQSSSSPYGKLSILNTPVPSVHDFSVTLDASHANLWLSSRWTDRISESYRRQMFVIFHRESMRAVLSSDFSIIENITIPNAYPRYSIGIHMNQRDLLKQFPDTPIEDLRILAISPRYLGTITRTWKSPVDVRPSLIPNPPSSQSQAYSERKLTTGQFSHWYANTPKPPKKTSRENFTRHLITVLEKASQCRYHITRNHPVVTDLSRFVPDHLQVFLKMRRAISIGNSTPRSIIDHALERGLDDSQSTVVIAALPKHHNLIKVIINRGWLEKSIPTLINQWRMGNHDSQIISQLIGFEEARPLYPEFLAYFKRNPDQYLYLRLRALPELENQLGEIVKHLWAETTVIHSPYQDPPPQLGIALHHGVTDAINSLAQFTRDNPGRQHRSANLIQQTFDLSHLKPRDRHDDQKINQWFLSKNPNEFEYDPITQLFVSKPSLD